MPIVIEGAGYGLGASSPAGWIAVGVGVTLEMGELFYDHVLTPTLNYSLDYSYRWD